MLKYIRLWWMFFKNNLSREMEFKHHFFLNILVEVFWTAVSVISFEIIFTQTPQIAGWSKGEVFLLYAVYRIISGIEAFLFMKNTERFEFLVNSGELDFILTKPVNIFFIATMRLVSLPGMTQTVLGLMLLIYASRLISFPWNIANLFLLSLVSFSGLLVKHSIKIFTATPVIWFHKIENITSLHIALFATTRFPAEAFPKTLRFLLTFLLPVLLVASIPSAVLLGKIDHKIAAIIFIASLGLYWLVSQFFYFALRHYSSASS